MKEQIKTIAGLLLAGLLLFGAYMIGVKTTEPKSENVAPAAAQSLPSGAVVLERKPATKPAKPKKPGTKVEREVSVTVQPDQAECEPVKLDLQLVKDGDGRRVVASSPNGQVIGGVDVPVEAAINPVSHKWAAGLSCDPANCMQTPGVWIERDLGRMRAGIDLIRQADGQAAARARIGWSF